MEAAACELENSDITLPNPNDVPHVINEAPAVSDDEDDEDFDNDEAKNTKT